MTGAEWGSLCLLIVLGGLAARPFRPSVDRGVTVAAIGLVAPAVTVGLGVWVALGLGYGLEGVALGVGAGYGLVMWLLLWFATYEPEPTVAYLEAAER